MMLQYAKIYKKCYNMLEVIFLKELTLTKPIVRVRRECILSHYWDFLDINFRFDPKACNSCHDIV